MSEESTTPDPAQRLHDAFAAASAEDLDGVTANLAPRDPVECHDVDRTVLSEIDRLLLDADTLRERLGS
jgi:hypothetical protein